MTKQSIISKTLDPRVTNIGAVGAALVAAARKEAAK